MARQSLVVQEVGSQIPKRLSTRLQPKELHALSDHSRASREALMIALNQVDKNCTFTSIDDLGVVKDQHGKPWLPHYSPTMQISLSHSHRFGVGFVYKGCKSVGVDIEKLRVIDIKHQAYYLDQAEIDLASTVYGDQLGPVAFWTIKEAYLKQLGVGLLREPSSLKVLKSEYQLGQMLTHLYDQLINQLVVVYSKIYKDHVYSYSVAA